MGGLYSLARIIPGITKAIIRQEIKPDRTLVFDDLERCGLNLKDILGVINIYVEHHGCRVVVISHEGKLNEEFQQTKEKLFGQTIKVEPQAAKAFDAFCLDYASPNIRDFLNAHRAAIIGIFNASGAKSLRVMRHVIEDLARLHEMLGEEHVNNNAAIVELVSLFSALNIEVRSGQLFEENLENRTNVRYAYELRRHGNRDGEPEKPPLVVADEKYTSVDLESNLLQDTPIIQMLIEGRYDQELIRDSLNNSSHFLKPEDAPPWKVVINFDDLEDEVIKPAFDRMQEQFDNREVTDSGEMLHIFALRLMMAERGILDDDVATVAEACKTYVDDLLADDRLPPRETDWRWFDRFERAHDGIGYWVTDAYRDYFKEIWDHLIAAKEKALEKQFPERTQQLLNLVRTDGRAFFEQVSQTSNGDNPYALIPVLSHIPANEFVGAWLESPRENWRSISYALKGRYEHTRLDNELKSERNWVRQVVRLLEDEVTKADGFQALRIKRIIPGSLIALEEN